MHVEDVMLDALQSGVIEPFMHTCRTSRTCYRCAGSSDDEYAHFDLRQLTSPVHLVLRVWIADVSSFQQYDAAGWLN